MTNTFQLNLQCVFGESTRIINFSTSKAFPMNGLFFLIIPCEKEKHCNAITGQFADMLLFTNRLVHQDGSLPDITMMNLTASREKEEDKMLEGAGEKRMEEPEGEGGKGRVEKGKEEEKEDEEKEDDYDEDNESEEEETTGKLCRLQILLSSALVNSGIRWFILGHPCSLQSSGFPSNFTYSLYQKNLN